jgi:hypothetical protein
MFRKIFFAFVIAITTQGVFAQQAAGLLDGRRFHIEIMKDGVLDSKERLVFADHQMDPLDCHQWGFTAAAYQAKNSGEMKTFSSVCRSEKEGTMAWQGKVKGQEIEGTMVWSKQGQATYNYTFKGREVKDEK